MENLEFELKQDCLDIYDKSRKEIGYTPHRLLSMIDSKGAKLTVIDIINDTEPSKAFFYYLNNERLDLTLEHFIVENKKYHQIVGEQTVKNAKERLRKYGGK